MTAAITCSPFTPAERPATEYYYFSHSFCDLTAVSQLLCSCICIFLRQGCRASDHIVCYIVCNPNHRIKIQFIRMFLRNTLDYFALHCFRDVPKAYLGPASCADVYELVVGLVNLSLVSVFTVQHLLPSCVSGHVSHDLIHCSTSLKFPMLFLCMMRVHQSKTFFDAVVQGIFRHCLTFLTFLFKIKQNVRMHGTSGWLLMLHPALLLCGQNKKANIKCITSCAAEINLTKSCQKQNLNLCRHISIHLCTTSSSSTEWPKKKKNHKSHIYLKV